MNKARVIVSIPVDVEVTLLGKGILAHQPIHDVGPIRLIPDVDVVLNDITGSTYCVHCRRVEVAEEPTDTNDFSVGRLETVGCRNLAASNMPNGFLCSYHQRFLQPESKGVFVRKVFSKGDIDASLMFPELRREVLSARQGLADHEIHDHLTYERLKDVQVEEDTMRRFLGRS